MANLKVEYASAFLVYQRATLFHRALQAIRLRGDVRFCGLVGDLQNKDFLPYPIFPPYAVTPTTGIATASTGVAIYLIFFANRNIKLSVVGKQDGFLLV